MHSPTSKLMHPLTRQGQLKACLLLLVVASAACERKTSSAAETLPSRRAEDTEPLARTLPDATASQPPRVAFLGDSLTAGYGLSATQAFPALLARKLAAENLPFQPLNAGVSGDTSAGGRRRVAWILKQRPALVVLELGANDGLRGLALAALEANLREIIATLQQSGAKVLLLGMRLPPNYGTEYARAFEALYPRIAEQLKLPFVPFFMEGVAGVPELNLPDGLHPTAAGHERLAENLAGALATLLRTLSADRDAGSSK